MRPLAMCCLVLLAAVACGPIDTGLGTTGSSDGGPVWTGGGGGTDAGTDAGTAGGGGGGSDAGTPPPASPCDGIVPASNPPAQSTTVPHDNGQACFWVTSDQQGTIGVESHGNDNADPLWHLYAPDGTATGSMRNGFDLYGMSSGFEGTQRANGQTWLVRWAPNAAEQNRTLLGGPGCSGVSSLAATSGTLVIGGCPGGSLTISRFDDAGKLTASRALTAQNVQAVGIVDARDQAFVVVWPGSAVGHNAQYVGRWFDGSLAATTDWFDLPGSGTAAPFLRPFIGGGVAMQVGGNWIAEVASGQASSTGPRPWLAPRSLNDFVIVRGGRAYALIPKYGAAQPRNKLELIEAGGQSCGVGTFPSEGLAVTIDGTVVGSNGDGGCDIRWWSAILR